MARFNNVTVAVGNPSVQILDTAGEEIDVTIQNVSNWNGSVATPGIPIWVSDSQLSLDEAPDATGLFGVGNPTTGFIISDKFFGATNNIVLKKFCGKLYARSPIANAFLEIWSKKSKQAQ